MDIIKRFKFTTAKLKSLPANESSSKSTDLEVSDTEITGLKCLSGKSGSKRFLLRYSFNGRKTSITIGRFPDIELSVARKLAREFKLLLVQGIDPKEHRKSQALCDPVETLPTVSEFFHSSYLPLAKKRKISWLDDITRFKLCLAIHDIHYDKLTAQDVLNVQLSLLSKTAKRSAYSPATCNRAIALLKTMGKQAQTYLSLMANEALKVTLLPENNVRTRYCNLLETKAIIKASLDCHCKSSGCFVALLFLTGCRASELRLRLWTDIDLNNRTLTIPRTKNALLMSFTYQI